MVEVTTTVWRETWVTFEIAVWVVVSMIVVEKGGGVTISVWVTFEVAL